MPAPKRIIYGGDGNSNMYFRENFDGKDAEFPAIHGSHFNPAQSLDRAALAHPNRANLIYGEQVWTVSESAKAARQIAELLLSCDVRSGERVVLISRNSPYHLLIHAACCRIGAVFVPISYRLQRRELAQMLQICTPSVVITDSETANEQKIFRQSEKAENLRTGI
ncbi:class I adenylate-forming enzyme family protein [Arcanobacterium hippocoleae]